MNIAHKLGGGGLCRVVYFIIQITAILSAVFWYCELVTQN